jgi:serine/threonine protein kinase
MEVIDSKIITEYEKLSQLISDMTARNINTRPKIEKILSEKELWRFNFYQIENQFKELIKIYANSDEKLFPILYEKLKQKREIQKKFLEKYLSNGKYEEEFKEIKKIDCGKFGAVFRVKNKKDKILYAFKKVAANEQNVEKKYNEVLTIRRMNCDFIVKFIDSWIEINKFKDNEETNDQNVSDLSSDKMLNKNYTHLVYIQMELCFETLEQTIERYKSINPLNYYILCQLVIELLESVQYLHSLKPPIIHKDLKLSKILLSYGIDGRFIKLGHFRLPNFHQFQGQSRTQGCGTPGYISPQVINSKYFDAKADIDSLVIILKQIFKA